MKALELADKLDSRISACWGTHAAIAKPCVKDTAAELRRLAEVNAELLGALEEVFSIGDRLVDDVYGYEFVEKAKAAIKMAKEVN